MSYAGSGPPSYPPSYTFGDPRNQHHERGFDFAPSGRNGVSPPPRYPSPPVSQHQHHHQEGPPDRAPPRSNPSPPNRPGSAATSRSPTTLEPETKVQKEVLHVVMRESATLNDLTALFQWVLAQPGFKVFAFLSRWHRFPLLFCRRDSSSHTSTFPLSELRKVNIEWHDANSLLTAKALIIQNNPRIEYCDRGTNQTLQPAKSAKNAARGASACFPWSGPHRCDAQFFLKPLSLFFILVRTTPNSSCSTWPNSMVAWSLFGR